jgi:thymidylate synthase (FAD)
MRIIKPTFEELSSADLYKKIEICGRVCYKSEDKITETSAIGFVKRICGYNHGSVLEHFALTFKISEALYLAIKSANIPFFSVSNVTCPLVSFNVRAFVTCYNNNLFTDILKPITKYMAVNYPDLFAFNSDEEVEEIEYITDYSTLTKEERYMHKRISIKITTDRGVTHELVRHRLASFSQESTRYCNYGKDKFGSEITVIEPCDLDENTYPIWKDAMEKAEKAYFDMIDNKATPQIARSVLPNSLKTELCMTATIEEWNLVFDLRCALGAHPDCRAIMIPIRDYFIKEGYLD